MTQNTMVEDLFYGDPGVAGAFYTDGARVFHYKTCIAYLDRVALVLYVLDSKATVTSRRMLNKLKEAARFAHYSVDNRGPVYFASLSVVCGEKLNTVLKQYPAEQLQEELNRRSAQRL